MKQKLLFSAAALALTLSATQARTGAMSEAIAKTADDIQRTFVAIETIANAEGAVALEAKGDKNVLTALFGANEAEVTKLLGETALADPAELKKALKGAAPQLARMAARSTNEGVIAVVAKLAKKPTTTVDPKAPAVDPKAPAVDPKAPAVDPKAPAVDPKATTVDPKAPAVDPKAPAVDPKAIALTPEQKTNAAVVESMFAVDPVTAEFAALLDAARVAGSEELKAFDKANAGTFAAGIKAEADAMTAVATFIATSKEQKVIDALKALNDKIAADQAAEELKLNKATVTTAFAAAKTAGKTTPALLKLWDALQKANETKEDALVKGVTLGDAKLATMDAADFDKVAELAAKNVNVAAIKAALSALGTAAAGTGTTFDAPELDEVATPEDAAKEQKKSDADKAAMAQDALDAIAALEADF